MPYSNYYRARCSEIPELMDQPCSYEEFRDCLEDLARVNRVTFAYRPTLRWLDQLVNKLPQSDKPLRIVDVGCGFGDMLRNIARWSRMRNVPVTLTGIDLNPYAARAAREASTPEDNIEFLTGNSFSYAGEIDVVISSLFTHHLSDTEIVRFLSWMEERTTRGWFISDLHRHPIPYHVFRVWAKIAGWHPFVQNDGPISILRSFTPSDWQKLCEAAGLSLQRANSRRAGERGTVNITWHMPFRLCVERLK